LSLRSVAVPVCLVLLAGTALVSCGRDPVENTIASVLEYRQGDLLYTFHIPTGTEALFDVVKDPDCLQNILPGNREDAAAARKQLEQEIGVDSLEELRDENNPVLKSLRGLGYI
jgi:hypothetical protein